MRTYAWEAEDWPAFKYETGDLNPLITAASIKRAHLEGLLKGAGLEDKQLAEVQATTEEALTTSLIEGEQLDPEATRSSVANQLGVDLGGVRPADRKSDGLVAMLVDASRNYQSPLTRERLEYWHQGLFVGSDAPWVGRLRTENDGVEQVVTGPYGRQRVLYEAPPGNRVQMEMRRFLQWFESPSNEPDVIRSGIAHLWFVTIHPFVDGNGRIARAIADLAFARVDQNGHRYFSMSSQIVDDRKEYEVALQSAQRGKTLNITVWLLWFVEAYLRSLDRSIELVQSCMRRTFFWARHSDFAFNERQRKILARVLGEWEGALTAGKWANITHVSADTAQRDLQELVDAGILVREGAGRGTKYSIREKPASL